MDENMESGGKCEGKYGGWRKIKPVNIGEHKRKKKVF